MDRQANAAPVIIRKKKTGSKVGGHHGGAWKVAYADFVTAMMAFFLIMWLINATTESQRKGLADYFSPSIPVNRVSGGGDGAFGGNHIFSDDELLHDGTDEEPPGTASVILLHTDSDQGDPGTASAEEAELFARIEELLLGRSGESEVTEIALQHIVTRISDEGLIVEVFDLPGAPLFEEGTDTPTAVMEVLADLITDVFGLVSNGVAVEGHSRAYPVVLANNPIWDLSTARAQRTRALLGGAGLQADRAHRVTGHADRRPAAMDALSSRNNRLEIILLRSQI